MMETEQIREYRVDTDVLESLKTKEVSSHIGLPMRSQNHHAIVVYLLEFSRQHVVTPPEGLPASFRERLVLLRVLCIHNMWRVRSEASQHYLSLRHDVARS